MAGRPRTRAKEAAAAAAAGGNVGEVPESSRNGVVEATPRAGTRDAPAQVTRIRGRARAREAPEPAKHPAPGPELRGVSDSAQANVAEGLAATLLPGLTVRIDRTKPQWCSGWQEDYVLESGESGELLAYIKEEYGGRTYKLTALAPGGTPLWVSKMNVGGRPREEGRILIRWKYEGDPDPDGSVGQPPAAVQPNGLGMADMVVMMKMVMGVSSEASAAQLNAVRESMASQGETQRHMMKLLVQERSDERNNASFGGQLQSLVDSTKALKKAGSLFGAVADGGSADGGATKGLMDGAMEQAMGHFVTNVMASEFGGEANAAPRKRDPQRRARRPPQTGIPEAIPRSRPAS